MKIPKDDLLLLAGRRHLRIGERPPRYHVADLADRILVLEAELAKARERIRHANQGAFFDLDPADAREAQRIRNEGGRA